jgi:hypothetical protein
LANKVDKLIKDVKIPFACTLANNAAFLKKVTFDGGVIDLHGLAA